MAFQLKQLVPCLLLLLWIMSFSYAKAQPPKSHDSDLQLDQRSNHTLDDAGFAFHLLDKESGSGQPVALDFVRNLSDSDANKTLVLSTIDHRIELWRFLHPGLKVEEASFTVSLVYQPLRNQSRGGLAFLILPFRPLAELELYGPLNFSNRTSGSANIPGTSVTVVIGVAAVHERSSMAPADLPFRALVVNITANPVAAAASCSYAVWINYDRAGQRLSVYVDVAGNPKPANTIAEAHLCVSSVAHPSVYFGVLSTVAQVLRSGVRWNAMIEDLPADYYLDDDGGFLLSKVPVVSYVLSSVAVAALAAGGVLCYLNSRYRMWHRDLEQLVKSMERLPGVPTKVDFADIKKATRNFHETMKLGGGGFGTVYRCTLPAAASKTDQPMDVAVKRFTHDVQNRRRSDFLAEVSIIHRLRHKNIVPLVGWSYHKGEPLLVFEYMSNGSLDQHIFYKDGGSSSASKPRTGATILRWATRYEIVNNIATGLHYVHHEYEPIVLHRDIKASNIMLDSSFHARLGDFGIACTIAADRNSATGIAGTWGYIAPEYAMCHKATRQTDIYALGVLILEVITGQRALADHQVMDDEDDHITDRVWRLHREERLLECVDAVLITAASEVDEEQVEAREDVTRLLLLGLACSNPNPSDRPTMPDVVQVIAKSMPPPEVPPLKPIFVWPPPEGWASDDNSTGMSGLSRSTDEQNVSLAQPMAQVRSFGGYASFELQSAQKRAIRHALFQPQHSI